MNFDMNAVWSRGIDLVRENFQLLAVIAAVFLLLPTLAIYLLIPDFQSFAEPGANPDVVAEKMGEILGPFIGIISITSLFQFAGYGAMIALMGDHRPTVGEALGKGLMTVPSLIAVLILFALAYMLGAFIVLIPFALLAAAIGVPGFAIVAIVPVLVFIVWLMARMSMTMPSLVLGNSLNPIKAITNSFKLTAPKQWSILLFWVMIIVAFMVISVLLNGVVSVFAALAGSGLGSLVIVGLANGVTSMITGMVMCGLTAAMFGQLSGPSDAAIEETFG
ncbi:MAG: hypothetical protein AAF687_06915 [Pseudomonadota bacterium]